MMRRFPMAMRRFAVLPGVCLLILFPACRHTTSTQLPPIFGTAGPVVYNARVQSIIDVLSPLIPTADVPAGFTERARAPQFQSNLPEKNLSVAYEDQAGNRIQFLVIVFASPEEAKRQLEISAAGLRTMPYRLPTITPQQRMLPLIAPCDANAAPPADSACKWKDVAAAPIGQASASFITTAPTEGRSGTWDVFVDGTTLAHLQIERAPSADNPNLRETLLAAFANHIHGAAP